MGSKRKSRAKRPKTVSDKISQKSPNNSQYVEMHNSEQDVENNRIVTNKNNISEIDISSDQSSNTEHNSKDGSTSADNQVSTTLHSEARLENGESISEDKMLEEMRISRELFDRIYSGSVVPMLPDRSWAVHCTDIPEKCVVVSQMAARRASGVGLIPLYVKQIIIDKDLNYEVYLTHSRTVSTHKTNKITSAEDLSDVIVYVNSLKVCSGGPDVSEYTNVSLECAFKDPSGKWRHNLCSLEVEEGEVCESCLTLDEMLKKHVKRNRTFLTNGTKRKRI